MGGWHDGTRGTGQTELLDGPAVGRGNESYYTVLSLPFVSAQGEGIHLPLDASSRKRLDFFIPGFKCLHMKGLVDEGRGGS